jgi:AraC family transcriptional activator of pobA
LNQILSNFTGYMKKESDIPSLDFEKFKSKFITKDFLPFDLSEGFKIFKIQDVIKHLKFPLPLHRTNYYDILFVSKGSQSVKHCGLRKYEINPGNIFFKSAGQITSGDIFGNDIVGFFCLLSDDFLPRNLGAVTPINSFPFFKYTGNPIIHLNKDEVHKFQFLFETIHQQYYSKTKTKTQNVIIASYINVIFHEAGAIHRRQNENKITNALSIAQTLTENFKDLVAQHYLTKRQVNDYAKLLYVTPNHLNKTIKTVTGKTASLFISEMILLEAKILLKQSNMNVAEIAFYLSFDDTSYFSRFFKKLSSVTPMEFRKKE